MLSWSATETGRSVNLAAIIDTSGDIGIAGGAELAQVGLSVAHEEPDGTAVESVARALSPRGAMKAAAVAGAFEILNRIVDATGLPVSRRHVEALAEIVDGLSLASFPHASLYGPPDLA